MEEAPRHDTDLAASLEALLLIQGDVLYKNRIPKLLECSKEDVDRAIETLSERIKNRENSGITLIQTDSAVSLATTPHISQKLAAIQKKTLERDIGSAGLEVLAILLYIGPSTRSRIDYIRGVNSSSTVRLLLMRKMVERVKNPDDSREYVYRPTVELLAHLGLTNQNDLPAFDEVHNELAQFAKTQKENDDLYDE